MQQSEDPFNKLNSDTGSLLHEGESKPEFQHERDEAKQRRMARVVSFNWNSYNSIFAKTIQIGDQQMAPMTVNELRVHGAVNTRTNFLDPLFQPLVADEQNHSSTVGEVIDKLRVASLKLDGLRMLFCSLHLNTKLTA